MSAKKQQLAELLTDPQSVYEALHDEAQRLGKPAQEIVERFTERLIRLATPTEPLTEAAPKPYSVLLLYPDYANDSGTETYYVFVTATDPIDAGEVAKRHAAAAQDAAIDPDDFALLLVTQGHNVSAALFGS